MGYTDETAELEKDIAAAQTKLRQLRNQQTIAAQQQAAATMRDTVTASIANAEKELASFEQLAIVALEKLDAAILERHKKFGQNLNAQFAGDGVTRASAEYTNLKASNLQRRDSLTKLRERLEQMTASEAREQAMQSKPSPESAVA